MYVRAWVRERVLMYVCMHVSYHCLIVMLYVKRPTSSPWAVWNPCKVNKALN